MSELRSQLKYCFPNHTLEHTSTGVLDTWTGTIRNRSTVITCAWRGRTKYYSEDIKRTHYDGHELTCQVNTSVKARLIILPRESQIPLQGKIFSFIGLTVVTGLSDRYDRLAIFCHEVEWAKRLLDDSHFSEIILGKLFPPHTKKRAGLTLTPALLSLRERVHIEKITPELMDSLLSVTLELADVIEQLPRPVREATPGRWESFCSRNPKLSVGLFFAAFLLFAALLPLALVGLVVLGLGEYLKIAFLLMFVWWWLRRRAKRNRVESNEKS